ncbi:CRISPR-associated endonuclease Cas1 [Colwellia sp. 12G3]|uniref:CRISPR-associated endonuclease Cas1 n=1 Tax=Colwellia sp. 12G3 TaxID=2058299 RepID=UPI0012FF337F|nr:CRISPR-associated endonuclease Cas1 [Colwellia sp. 12G3]
METIFIDRKSTKLKCNQQRLYISKSIDSDKENNTTASIPLSHLRSLVISCDCELSSGMLRQLAKFDVSLICLNNRNPDASFISINESHGNVLRRMNQYYLLSCPSLRSRFSTIIIKRKISAQRTLLKNMSNHYKALAGPLLFASKTLSQQQIKLNKPEMIVNEVMGVEGYASKVYFQAYKRIFSANLLFTKRTKRPPEDPVNVILSLSYTLLYYEAQRACHGQSLDPMIPILHSTSYGRASLACDLQECLRPDIDYWVWRLFQQRILRLDHFTLVDSACILNKSGRKHYYNALPEVMTLWRNKLRKHAMFLVKIIDNTPNFNQTERY